MMNDKKRRRRTGCLTCRTRRVKCDEGKPSCERCNAANIECVGYEQKRHVEVRRPHQSSTARPVVDKPPALGGRHANSMPSPQSRPDGLPLVALPSNPLPLQRPHSRARDILAYHQFLFRTLPILFLPEHLHYWRDRICQEAWEIEYLYDTILAIGGAHRAVLMMSSTIEDDRDGGVENKVIAVQAYTRALQGLSDNLKKSEKALDLFVGALLLLALFECFPGNFPAALRHAYIACRYFLFMQANEHHQGQPYMTAIDSCLRSLGQIFRIILPSPILRLPVPQSRISSPITGALTPSSTINADERTSPPLLLQRLLDFVSENPEMDDLIWSPLSPYQKSISADKIYAFQGELRDWATVHRHVLPQFGSEVAVSTLSDFTWKAIDDLPIPPRAQSPLSSQLSLVAALHRFYMARTMWALSLLGDDSDRHEIYAYLYFYEVMQLAASVTERIGSIPGQDPIYIPRETLGIGFLPMLYFTGQCSPRPSWLRWSMEKLNQIGQEGLFRGKDFAKSLNALYTFEMYNSVDSPLMLDRFPSPASRVISVLIPEEDGRRFITYYAGPMPTRHEGDSAMDQYYPLGHARWSSVSGDESGKPDIEFYKSQRTMKTQFNADWLLRQQPMQDWITWSSLMEFNIDLLLRDHVSGCHLWPGGDFQVVLGAFSRG